MKQLFLRSFALLLCLCLLGGAASSLAAEARTNADTMSAEEWEEMDEAFRFVDRFGTDAKVETNADGMPIGRQFVSDHWNEDVLLTMAEEWDKQFEVRKAEVSL